MIRRDIAAGEKLKIKGAPSVFVNGNAVVFPDGINETALMEAVNAEVMRMNSLTSRPGGNYLIASLLNQQIQAGAMASDALGRPVRGAKDALVTIVEYSDYECPFCSRVEPTLAKLLQEYDNVRFVFSHHPLPFHKNAKLASQAAYAAGLQGKFWEMHDTLFKHQKQLGEVNLIGYAEELGLDMDQFKADLHAPSTVAAIDANLAEADTHRISGTPNFLINGVAFTGARPYEQFKKAVDEAIAKAEPIRAKTGLTGDALYAEIMKSGTNAEQDNVAKMPMDHMQRIERAGKFLAEAEKANAEKPMAVSQGVSYAKGPDDAKVVIYMFSEIQCPFCSRVEPTIAELEKEYAGKIKIVFKNFPLAFHRDAKLASEAALAAGEQGKFWEMHDLLFQNQKNLGREALTGYAKQLGLDVAQFDAALDSHKFASQVDLELKEGQDNGITGTPSFFINGKKLVGAQPLEKFKAEIDAALQ